MVCVYGMAYIVWLPLSFGLVAGCPLASHEAEHRQGMDSTCPGDGAALLSSLYRRICYARAQTPLRTFTLCRLRMLVVWLVLVNA
jgi:hypothetical protein